jgi:AcrR family transcriptional regulator
MNTDSRFHVNPAVAGARPAPSQDRSRVTAERFIAAAFTLLETRTFEALSVADLAREAGRSVGAFYQRFGSKDDFLTVLMTAYFAKAAVERARVLAEGEDESVIEAVLAESFAAIMHNRNLWHAALQRSAADPTFWTQFIPYVQRSRERMAERVGELRGAPLEDAEVRRLHIAVQVFNSVINNQMINSPGPLSLNSPDFLPSLLAVFRAVYAAGP